MKIIRLSITAVPGIHCPLLVSLDTACIWYTDMQANIFTQKIKINLSFKMRIIEIKMRILRMCELKILTNKVLNISSGKLERISSLFFKGPHNQCFVVC